MAKPGRLPDFRKMYPEALVVPATIDEIMLLYVKGEK